MTGVAAAIVKERALASGLGTKEQPLKYLQQDFEALRSECLTSGQLFEDVSFPAIDSSLGFKELGPGSSKVQGLQWKRPTELCTDPLFISGGATRTDICQGELGNSSLLAATTSSTLNEQILHRVVPQDQSFQKKHAGIFHFQIWKFGEWVDVVIDDQLPTKNGELLFAQSKEGNEFSSALLEKAYAKVNGSYEALSGGATTESFEDFTGGIAESYKLKEAPPNLFKIIHKALQTGSLLGCSIEITSAAETEAVTSQKLVKGHAYSVTAAEEVNYKGSQEKLIRIRNPSGAVEWTGGWSNNSSEWNSVDPEVRDRLIKRCDDGEFWMSYNDFLRHYSQLDICTLTPDTLASDKYKKWSQTKFGGSWRPGSTAGGCRNFPNTFWMNPQYLIKLDKTDDDPDEDEEGCTIIVGLMQKNRRQRMKMGEEMHDIGFSIYKVPEPLTGKTNTHLSKDFFLTTKAAKTSGIHTNLREVLNRFRLPPGEYVIVPSTYEPNKAGDFCIRVFSEKNAEAQIVDDELEANIEEVNTDEIDANFEKLFQQLAGEDKEISAFKLCNILKQELSKSPNIKSDGLSIETCKTIVDLLDTDGSGKLGIKQFYELWSKIQKYQKIYKNIDVDRSGTMSAYEMRKALEEAGFKLNRAMHQLIIARFADDNLSIDFDNFVRCLIRLEMMFKLFDKMDVEKTGTVSLDLLNWLSFTIM